MKTTNFVTLVILSTLAIAGCGDQPPSDPKSNLSAQNQGPSARSDQQAGDKNETSAAASGPVESTLPFKDLDPATAAKGVDPGRILIDVAGKDANGQPLSLSDYRGKVILLDTWASW